MQGRTAPTVWGLTASDGPADVTVGEGRRRAPVPDIRRPRRRTDAGGYDDCTLAPTAVVGSLPFAPELVIPAVLDMHKRFGEHIYSQYGFLDAFNLSFDFDIPLRHGRYIPGFGWVAGDYLGIDQGAIVAMIENYRSAMIWDVMRKNPYLQAGLLLVRFRRRVAHCLGAIMPACPAFRSAAAPSYLSSPHVLLVGGCSPRDSSPTPSDSGRWAAKAKSSPSLWRNTNGRIPASVSRSSSCRGAPRTRSC